MYLLFGRIASDKLLNFCNDHLQTWFTTASDPQKVLFKGKQSLVDLKNIVITLINKILNDNIEYAAVGKSKAGLEQKVFGFIKV